MTQQPMKLETLRGGIIVSVQADAGEPFYSPEAIVTMAKSVVNGGAIALRLANPDNIAAIKKALPQMPVLGITKPKNIPANYQELVYITPTFEDVAALHAVGTDIVALDATQRARPDGSTLESIVRKTREQFPNLMLMADIATLEEGLHAAALGFDLISTTLSGYTSDTAAKVKSGPDFQLMRDLSKQVKTPIIMEGRVWEPGEVTQSFEAGAFAVVIGSAITRPHLITQRFCQAIPANVSTGRS